MDLPIDFSKTVETAARFGWIALPILVVGIPIYRWVETRRRVKSFMGLEDRSRAQSLGAYAKGVEIAAVLLAVIAFLYEFGYEKQRDRATRNAQLLAQIADLSLAEGEQLNITSLAIKTIMTLLAEENVPMVGISVPNAQLIGIQLPRANLEGAHLLGANLEGAHLLGANLEGANLGARLEGAILGRANLEGAHFFVAHLEGANLEGASFENARNLTQTMLAAAKPSPPPISLPEGLYWPFEEDKSGDWIRKQ